jgi:hypothetical protein
MVRRFVALVVVAIVGAGAALIVSATPAAASCVGGITPATDVERADLVFVGTVTSLTNEDRWATFQIEDLWKGEPPANEVEVRAGPAAPGGGIDARTSVDRTFQSGARYLVFAYDPATHGYPTMWGVDSRYEDNSCSATQPYTDDLAQYRPPAARRNDAAPVPTTRQPSAVTASTAASYGDIPRNVALAAAVAAVIVLVLAARSFAQGSTNPRRR